MSNADFYEQFRELTKDMPRFKDGRVDYTGTKKALVLNCFVKCRNEILLLKRSHKVASYKGKWNSVGGYLDEEKPIEIKVLEELVDELGISRENMANISVKQPYELHDAEINKTWIIYPCLAELREMQEIKLDWEHSEFKWIKPDELMRYDVISGLSAAMEKAMK